MLKGQAGYKLENTIKRYPWGSLEYLQKLLGAESADEPWAELWMGVHPAGPSMIRSGGTALPLSEADEVRAEKNGVPFLLKFLAAARPLSIQVHPNREQARAGWERENAAGLAPDAPERNYRDSNHKPEILCALSPFIAMAGFRKQTVTAAFLREFFRRCGKSSGEAEKLRNKLLSAVEEGYAVLLRTLFDLSPDEKALITSASSLAAAGSPVTDSISSESVDPFGLCARFAEAYPGDSAVLSPLYLNVISLKPREAIYLPAGILHAYVEGFGVECMANSDNVLRGGLSGKHIDQNELFAITRFEPFEPPLIFGGEGPPGVYRYRTGAEEFTLYRITSRASLFEAEEPAIFAVTGGRVEVKNGAGASLDLRQGESAYLPRRAAGEKLRLEGNFTLFAALDTAGNGGTSRENSR
ncbi:MAG: mannose-6-phosphate isomerase, class I [Treponema sp.]|jgi:mannose-6-phosphate isomerase|nr:mannose-6-phosphate isomerase, class I [Treponema sp.]